MNVPVISTYFFFNSVYIPHWGLVHIVTQAWYSMRLERVPNGQSLIVSSARIWVTSSRLSVTSESPQLHLSPRTRVPVCDLAPISSGSGGGGSVFQN